MVPTLHLPRHAATLAGGAAVAALSLVALGVWAALRKQPSPEELEARRRQHLTSVGRIIDGSLIGAHPDELAPAVILYRYRVAGVTYECAQDVSALASPPRELHLEFPIQVRYDPANAADSIVIAEEWNGLWSIGHIDRTPYRHDAGARAKTQ